MTALQVTEDIAAVQASGDAILASIEGADPAVALPAEAAATVLNLTASLVTAAITAFQNASDTPITAESIAALMPDATPLPAPPSGT
jgi:hypothetical protein